jgi:acyl-coenzyme A synthetase/AMP-(fatty) acid ligase
MLVVAPTHYKVALEMLTGHLGLPRHEAQQRIWVMDRLWEGARQVSPLGLEEGGVNDVRSLLGLGRLEEEEKFDGVDADETVYICYSSGTTVRPSLPIP